MYTQIVLTLILIVLIWIALGLQLLFSSIRLVGSIFKPSSRKHLALERNGLPWVAKMAAVKVVAHFAIRHIGKKLK